MNRHNNLLHSILAGTAAATILSLISGVTGYSIGRAQDNYPLAELNKNVKLLEAKLDNAMASMSLPADLPGTLPVRRKGWLVRAFEPAKPANNLAALRDANDAGSFVHTGSWINMQQHREHEGIFLPADAALNSRGLFIPDKTGNYVFAMHMSYTGDEDQRQVRTVACFVDVKTSDQTAVIAGKLTADSMTQKATLLAPDKLFLTAGHPELLDTLVACDMPPGVSGKNVAFRICVRHESETGFRPVPAYLPDA